MPGSLFTMSTGKDYRLRTVLHSAGLTEDDIDALLVIDEPDGVDSTTGSSLAQWWVDELHARRKTAASELKYWGTTSYEQLVNLDFWNSHFNLGFSRPQLAAVDASVPDFPLENNPLKYLVLCWTLGTLEQTLDAKLQIMKLVYGAKLDVSPQFQTDAEHTTLVAGAPGFEPNRLWWEIIDLGANRDKAPDQVPPATAAGIEVFDAACQHLGAVRAHNGQSNPYWDVPGLRVKVKDAPKVCAPYVVGSSDGYVSVSVYWSDYADSSYAEPVREG